MEITEETFKTTLPIQIRFNDIDALGHINNNIYFSYFDLGKTDYFEKIKRSLVDWTEGIVVIANINADFLSPIYYKEKIEVDTKVTKLGEKSGVLLQQIRSVKTNEIKCRCQTVFVTYNPDTQSSMAIPDVWRNAISQFEEREF